MDFGPLRWLLLFSLAWPGKSQPLRTIKNQKLKIKLPLVNLLRPLYQEQGWRGLH